MTSVNLYVMNPTRAMTRIGVPNKYLCRLHIIPPVSLLLRINPRLLVTRSYLPAYESPRSQVRVNIELAVVDVEHPKTMATNCQVRVGGHNSVTNTTGNLYILKITLRDTTS
jgi:hypothetical protein